MEFLKNMSQEDRSNLQGFLEIIEEFTKLSAIQLSNKYTEYINKKDYAMTTIISIIMLNKMREVVNIQLIQVEDLKKENKNLKSHIMSMPDGELFFEAKRHYEEVLQKNAL